jgi:DNA repair protein RadC
MEKSPATNDWTKIAEVEIVYKTKIKASERPHIRVSSDAYRLFLQTWDPGKIELVEEFKVMPLNRANRVLGICALSTGCISSALVDARLIFGLLIKAAACNAILCHCHPSGNTKPSDADVKLTARLVEAGKLLDIKILDRLIITPDNYYSFADEGAI